jgi:hypothetical protein
MTLFRDVYVTGTEQTIVVHPRKACAGHPCTIHAPSDHHMIKWPTHWRSDRKFMERICPHNIGHPDPDHMTYLETVLSEEAVWAEGIHGCDGCCVRRNVES